MLSKIFNRNTVNISYSCTSNTKKIFKGQNIKNLNLSGANVNTIKECCNKTKCPLNGNYKVEGMVYRVIVEQEMGQEKYILDPRRGCLKWGGINTTLLLNWQSKRIVQNLPVWNVREKNNKSPSIKWDILKKTWACNSGGEMCRLCQKEKLAIMMYTNWSNLLNERSEVMADCKHARRFLLTNNDHRS